MKAILTTTLLLLVTSSAFGNLLVNAGFETEGTDPEKAESWEDNDRGGIWGNSIRTDWQAYRGTFAAAFRGNWSGLDHAGWWQKCAVEAARPYHLSAYFMWDNEWEADAFELRVEWYSNGRKVRVDQRKIAHLPEGKWTLKSIDVSAPQEADTAHIVVDVTGIGTEGVLYMDEIAFALQ